ncbi:hypothetical protein GLAREA_04437 [Glarea lozoyensis ATCC 20868]|uniref:Uncharacterized protein n=1 Tax=Glarea lozoyensis (strain ATCC 20868 / MF5171) TaxID=1116229 RepID=S3D6H3_GLAL2|nr:uncharacterized protein GLAREA_04437 [Glarea lozoyensis ATCC 20868]EPE27646.1 hypothetical protein GLAREA_04437 [Glarea lozoyensis ATCC 20868]
MSMKAHRQGRDATNFLSRLSCESKLLNTHGYSGQLNAKTKIRDGVLLFRDQVVLLLPASKPYPVARYISGGIFRMCCHHDFSDYKNFYKAGVSIPRSDRVATHQNNEGIISCNHCHTEFRVDFKSFGSAVNAIFITRWLDLGDGCDPKEEKLKNRMGTGYNRREVTFRRGSICAAFEGRPESEFLFDAHINTDELVKRYRPR